MVAKECYDEDFPEIEPIDSKFIICQIGSVRKLERLRIKAKGNEYSPNM